MDTNSYLELLLNDSPNPCYCTDFETGEMIFQNRAMIRLFQKERCTLDPNAAPLTCPLCPTKSINTDTFVEHYHYNALLDKHFRVNNTILVHGTRKINLCKYSTTPLYTSEEISYEEALAKAADILAQQDIENLALSFLTLLGQFYNCEKTCIFHIDPVDHKIAPLKSWYKTEDDEIKIGALDDLYLIKTLLELFENSPRNGVVELDAFAGKYQTITREFEFFSQYRIFNLLLYPIEMDKEIAGFVAIINREEVGSDSRLLQALSRFLEESFAKHHAIKELEEISQADRLTHFLRRSKYSEKLTELQNNPPKTLGVLFININGLRKVNEEQGFEAGDRLIVRSANILREFCTEPFYRVSGDEFLCFLPEIPEETLLERVDSLQKHLISLDENLFAIGYAWKTRTRDVLKLVSEADTMMYINKQDFYHSVRKTGKNTMSNEVLNDLLTALEEEEFTVYLQPQFRLMDEQVIGAEALIRRFHKGKMVFPDEFIPLYEQNSVIRHVDLFVLEFICQRMVEWRKQGVLLPVSVNLSRVTLLEYNIPQIVADICNKYDIPPKYIVIEVTERVGLIENNVASALIQQFMSLGFKISLDDFGCAYSNIVTLVKISVDEIKIDKSLVDDILTSEKNQIIVGNLLNMCNSFQNTKTLAEGIEYAEQAEILREYGCTYGQGYYYSRPIPAEEFNEKYIKTPESLE